MLDPIRNPFTPSAEMIAELREKLPDQVPDEFESWPPKRQWDLYHNLIDKLRGFTEPTSVPKQKFVLRSGSNPEHSGSPAPVVAPLRRCWSMTTNGCTSIRVGTCASSLSTGRNSKARCIRPTSLHLYWPPPRMKAF